MSLLDDAMTACVLMSATETGDSEGGHLKSWTDGASFLAALALNQSTEMPKGERADMKRSYAVTTYERELGFHDVFRRLSDGAVFRVTSDSTDRETPARASFVARQVTAERWVLT